MNTLELTKLVSKYLAPIHFGKVRDSFQVPGDETLRLVITQDRRSIFDFKLGDVAPKIGEVLNATNIFFRLRMTEKGIPHDLVAFGSDIDKFLPNELRNIPDLHKRGLIVRELEMYPIECVQRKYLTGGGFDIYSNAANNRTLCGHILPEGLQNGSLLPSILFTPTTKAEMGHDLPMDFNVVRSDYPLLEEATRKLFHLVDSLVTKTNQFIWVDGKAEGGIDPLTGQFAWGDEVGTFDSSRIWRVCDYAKWPEEMPKAYDKEELRQWGRSIGIHARNPLLDSDIEYVRGLRIPDDVQYRTKMRAFEYFRSISGYSLSEFQKRIMRISYP
jgi:phosphoribosylaminoimidazole-succinocarboxamide synthase